MSNVESLSEAAAARLQDEANRFTAGTKRWLGIFGTLLFAGCVVFAAGTADTASEFLVVLPASLGILGASTLLGTFFGLLFGMPRAVERADSKATFARFSTNSNLLKVSDWVTTVLVGLSLVNLRAIPGGLDRLGDWAAPALGDQPGSSTFAVLLTVAGSMAGFMLAYLWTTVSFRGHLEIAARDIETAGQQLASRVASGELDGSAVEARLHSESPELLEHLQKETDTVPPLLRELAREEQARRAADQPSQPDP
jgi:hypothetical protein